MLTRRDFIKMLVAVGGPMLLPFSRQKRLYPLLEQSTTFPQSFLVGELYAGFLLLPDGAPVPPIVKYPERGVPTFCGVGAGRNGPTAITRSFSAVGELAREVSFPIYTPGKLPEGLRLARASLIQHETGEIFAAVVDFQSRESSSDDDWETTVSVWAQPEFPRPFPLWSSQPVERGGPAVILAKVDFLPSPGIMVVTRKGAVFHWIRNDILYTLIAESGLSGEETLALVSSLSPGKDH